LGRFGSEAFGKCSAGALAIAWSINVDPDGLHGEPVENGGSDGCVAEIPAPLAELDVRGYGSAAVAVTLVDEVVESVGSGGLVGTLSDLSDPDIVNDEQFWFGPSLETLWIGLVGEASVQVVEQVDATGVADGDLLLASAKAESLEQVAFAGTSLAGNDDVIVAPHEVETTEFDEEGLVEGRLKVPVESFQRLALGQAASGETVGDATDALVIDLDAKDVFEQGGVAWAILGSPVEQFVELGEGLSQS